MSATETFGAGAELERLAAAADVPDRAARLGAAKVQARAALADVDAARNAHIHLDLDRPMDEHKAAMKHIERSVFKCELALRSLMDHLDATEAGR